LSASKRPKRKQGRKPRGPIPTEVPEEDEIDPDHPPLWKILLALLWQNRWLALIVAGVALVLFWGLPTAVRSVFRVAANSQSSKLARLGGEYIAKGNLEAARMSAETSLRLAPENPDALRLLASIFQTEGRTADAFEAYQKLSRTGYATLEEFKGFAILASQKGYTSIANWLATWVAQQGEPDFPFMMQAASLDSEGKKDEALAMLREGLAVSNSDLARRELARFLLANSEYGESNGEVYSLLKDVAKGDGTMGHEALVVGILSGVVPLEERPAWLERMRRHPLANEQTYAIANAVEVAADPSAKPRIVKALVTRVYGKSLDDRLLAARWLLRHGEAARVMEIIPLEQARSRPDALSIWLEAQAALGQWQMIHDAMGANMLSLPPSSGRLVYGQALKKIGRIDEGRSQYRQALLELGGDPDQLLPALAFLHSDGEKDLFRENVKPLLAREDTALKSVQQIAPAIQQEGDAAALRDFLQLTSDSGPLAKYSALLNEMAYLDLVLGRPVDHSSIDQRSANFPDNPAFRLTNALSQLHQGSKAKALLIAENPKLRARDLPPQHQLILACILAANGKTSEADQIAKPLSVAPLTVQERKMLGTYLH
jgi:tetratricopeptide (TPR) repeat protein